MRFTVSALVLVCGGLGCSAAPVAPPRVGVAPDEPVAEAARPDHQAVVQQFAEHDRANDWTSNVCDAIERDFLALAEAGRLGGKGRSEAVYNAGLTRQRCGDHGAAKAHFERAMRLGVNPSAAIQLAIYAEREGRAGLDAAIALLDGVPPTPDRVGAEARLRLAALRIKRRSAWGGVGCVDDLDCAEKNIKMALTLGAATADALNQFALYYLARARQKAPAAAASSTVSTRQARGHSALQLDLAAQTGEQLTRRFPRYAAGHNTAGLIRLQQGNPRGAALAFEAALGLDPNLFEAWVNLASVRLSFRDFAGAERAYRAALDQHPDDYDARLGLALALRGQLGAVGSQEAIAAVQEQLTLATKIDPERPEAYYNGAILMHEYVLRPIESTKEGFPIRYALHTLYGTFLQKAGSLPAYAAAVQKARARQAELEPWGGRIPKDFQPIDHAPPALPTPEELEAKGE